MPLLSSQTSSVFSYGFNDPVSVRFIGSANSTSTTMSPPAGLEVGDIVFVASFSKTPIGAWSTSSTTVSSNILPSLTPITPTSPSAVTNPSLYTTTTGMGYSIGYYRVTGVNITSTISNLVASTTGGHVALAFRNVSTTDTIYASSSISTATSQVNPSPITITTTSKLVATDDPQVFDTYVVPSLREGSMIFSLAFLADDVDFAVTLPTNFKNLQFNSFGISGAGGSIFSSAYVSNTFIINQTIDPTAYSGGSDTYTAFTIGLPVADL